MAKKKEGFIRFNTIKNYINDTFKMRSSDSAVKKLIKDFDATIENVITDAMKSAKQDKTNATPSWNKILFQQN